MALVDVDIATLDGRNTMSNKIARSVRVHLQTISGATNLQKEISTKACLLDQLFDRQCSNTHGL